MYGASLILILIFTYLGLYFIITSSFTFPSSQAIKILKSVNKESITKKQAIYNSTTGIFIMQLAKSIKISKYEKNKLEADFKKVNIKLTAEEFKAKSIVAAVMPLPLIFLFVLIKGPIGAICIVFCLLLSVQQYFVQKIKIEKRLKSMKERILDDVPRFVGNFRHSLKGTRDYVNILDKYRKICCPEFKYDLDVLIYDLKTINHEEALKRFDARLGIPKLSPFINIVIGISQGEEPEFTAIDNDMNALMFLTLDRKIQSAPGKVNVRIAALVICGLVTFISPIIYTVLKAKQFVQ